MKNERMKIKNLLEYYEYGKIPSRPLHLDVKLIDEDRTFAAGKAILRRVMIITKFENGSEFEFPVSCAVPKSVQRPPVFLHINERSGIPDKFQPTEELCDEGFAVFTLDCNSIAGNDENFRRGAAPHLIGNRRKLDSPGKLAMWAWGAMRVMDLIETMREVDRNSVAVVGHGILGSAALLAGAFDERFAFVIANSSGFSGAASRVFSKGALFELKRRSPQLFCKRYNKLLGEEASLPFDQHALLSLVAPRFLIIDTASDCFTDAPQAELYSSYIASEAYKAYGKSGLVCNECANPCEIYDEEKPICYPDGDIVYRKRMGTPYLAREDWKMYMSYVKNRRKVNL